MVTSRILLALGAVAAVSGCSSSSTSNPPAQIPGGSVSSQAVHAAVRRARAEMSCPAAAGVISSQQILNPVMWGGFERSEFTVVVSGCDKKATYQVVCTQDTNLGGADGGCLAASSK